MKVRTLLVIGLFLVLYGAGYGVCRWRKVLVWDERYSIPDRGMPLVRSIQPGRDLRTNWIGSLKNTVAPSVHFFFLPLAYVENHVRA